MDAAPLFGGGGGAAPASSDVGPAAALVLASTFELVAAASLSSTAGIAAGAVSAALSGLLLALTLAVKLPTPLPATFAPNATRFLLAWWSLACLGLTFTGPFTTLGNGHLSTWGALFASVAAALPYSGHLARAVDRFVRLARGTLDSSSSSASAPPSWRCRHSAATCTAAQAWTRGRSLWASSRRRGAVGF